MQWSMTKKPKNLTEFYGGNKVLFKNFIESFHSDHPLSKICLLHGPSGVGKTLLCELTSQDNTLDLFYSNASEERNKDFMGEVMKQTVTGARKLVVIDEFESIRKNLSKIIIKYEKFIAHPLIIICNEQYKVSTDLRKLCWEVELTKPTKMDLQLFIESFIEINNITINTNNMNKIVKNSCSYRGVINNTQIFVETGIMYKEFEHFDNISDRIRKSVQGIDANLTNEELMGWTASNATNQSVTAQLNLLMGYNRISGGLQSHIRNLFNYSNIPDGKLEYFFTKKDKPKKKGFGKKKGFSKSKSKTSKKIDVRKMTQPVQIVVEAKSDDVSKWM